MSGDLPEIECHECGAIFTVIWHRNPSIDGVEFCPFCGFENDDWQVVNGGDE